MKDHVRNSEAMPFVELPLLEYALIARAVRESSFSDAIVAIQKWRRAWIWTYAVIGMAVGTLIGYAFGG